MLQEREHRIASYNKGCRCPECSLAALERWRAHRQRRMLARAVADRFVGWERCQVCDGFFKTDRGLVLHERRVHGSL